MPSLRSAVGLELDAATATAAGRGGIASMRGSGMLATFPVVASGGVSSTSMRLSSASVSGTSTLPVSSLLAGISLPLPLRSLWSGTSAESCSTSVRVVGTTAARGGEGTSGSAGPALVSDS
jgi:hypothetical protein